MSLTSTDIRHAYMLIHNLPSIAELEKLGMLDAKLFPAEDLELDIDEFMVKHGFKSEDVAKEAPPLVDNFARALAHEERAKIDIENADAIKDKSVNQKRVYTKKAK